MRARNREVDIKTEVVTTNSSIPTGAKNTNLTILKKSIVDCIKDPGDAICIEIASTISDGGYFIKNNPHMSDMICRVFGKDIIAVGGAQIVIEQANNPGQSPFYPVVLGYKFRKLLVGLPTKHQKYDPANPMTYELLKNVDSSKKESAVNTKIVPGYLCKTKMQDLESLLERLVDFVTQLGLKKIFIPPLNSFDPQIPDADVIELYESLLDSRFVVVQS